ncbi:GNAT family N-acetyltransferase [Fulvivirgaceae bacterium BMA10]|uniref:GNAT family N-acetyltransferase n=1 Tax=Splendidivirga corallicola TaxID=3051826 RepID=A0ABT8KX53_9BACT|nr:GNAT family N-acetyltransferase [Fulvivirgaceae bacterium BMA10]
MDNIDVVSYSELYESSHTAFATKMWPKRIRRRVPEYNRWKFRGPEKGEVETLLLAVSGERVVGQLGLVPVNFRVKGKIYKTYWTVDLMVDPDFRRRGIASKLYKRAIENCDIAVANGSNEGGSGAMIKLGFEKIKGPKKMLFPIDFRAVLSFKLSEKYDALVPFMAILAKPLYFFRSIKLHTTNTKNIRQVSWKELIEDVKKFQDELELPHPHHDKDFMHWRCSNFKDFNKEPRAIRTKDGSFAIYTKASNSLYVYEWHSVNEKDTTELYAYLLKEAKAFKVATISTVCNFEEDEVFLKKLGFIPMRKTLSTQLFHPPNHEFNHLGKFYYSLYDADENI